MERLSNLQAWAVSQALPEPILTKILNLSARACHQLTHLTLVNNYAVQTGLR
jgi:hypothetical protein